MSEDREVQPGEFRCAMCGGVFVMEWDDEEAEEEATLKGVDPDDSAVVCDDCYRLTPYGANPELG